MRTIQNIILVSGATLRNLPHYRLNPVECAELQWQVEELLGKGIIRECLSPLLFLPFWIPRRMGLGECVDRQVINKITIKYRFLSFLDDMLYMITNAAIFSKIDLKSVYHQIRIKQGDEWKTAFKIQDGLFE